VLSRGDDVVPIPGTTKPHRVEENIAALDISLTGDDLRRLDEAVPAGGRVGRPLPGRDDDPPQRLRARAAVKLASLRRELLYHRGSVGFFLSG